MSAKQLRRLMAVAVWIQLVAALSAADSDYNEIGTLKGQVVIVNHPDLGRTPAAGMYFLLQRVGCRKCMVGIRADIDGLYSAHLGVGRYRISCVDPERDEIDLIRQGQPREIVVVPRPDETVFNIELELAQSP